jgi:hypothetical protein
MLPAALDDVGQWGRFVDEGKELQLYIYPVIQVGCNDFDRESRNRGGKILTENCLFIKDDERAGCMDACGSDTYTNLDDAMRVSQ